MLDAGCWIEIDAADRKQFVLDLRTAHKNAICGLLGGACAILALESPFNVAVAVATRCDLSWFGQTVTKIDVADRKQFVWDL